MHLIRPEMGHKNTTPKLTSSQKRAVLSYSAIALWGYLLSSSARFPFRDLHVISFINLFTMALTCLIPLYILQVRDSYRVGAVIGILYMVGGFVIDPPAPWLSNPSFVSLLMWLSVYTVGTLGVYYSSLAYQQS
jgi:hypothetical protein